MKIYISGAISKNEFAEEEFKAAEDAVKAKFNATVINPYLVLSQLPKLEHAEYMKVCFAMMDICDAVYFIDGWEESTGSSQEMGYAIAKGMKIYL